MGEGRETRVGGVLNVTHYRTVKKHHITAGGPQVLEATNRNSCGQPFRPPVDDMLDLRGSK